MEPQDPHGTVRMIAGTGRREHLMYNTTVQELQRGMKLAQLAATVDEGVACTMCKLVDPKLTESIRSN